VGGICPILKAGFFMLSSAAAKRVSPTCSVANQGSVCSVSNRQVSFSRQWPNTREPAGSGTFIADNPQALTVTSWRFTMRTFSWLVGVVCLTISASAAQADDDKKSKGDGKTLTDSEFVDKASSSGTTEVVLGNIGLARSTHADVKKFSERLVKDHSKANMELLSIVSDLRIAIPEKPLPEHEKHIVHFRDEKGKDFDKEFMKHMVKSHEDGVKLFTRASKELKNDRLKAFAAKTLPTLKEHLEMAKKIHEQVSTATR
jgi:putative membrane protein